MICEVQTPHGRIFHRISESTRSGAATCAEIAAHDTAMKPTVNARMAFRIAVILVAAAGGYWSLSCCGPTGRSVHATTVS